MAPSIAPHTTLTLHYYNVYEVGQELNQSLEPVCRLGEAVINSGQELMIVGRSLLVLVVY